MIQLVWHDNAIAKARGECLKTAYIESVDSLTARLFGGPQMNEIVNATAHESHTCAIFNDASIVAITQ